MAWLFFSFFVLLFTHLGEEKRMPQGHVMFFRVCLVLTLSIMTGLGSVVGNDHPAYVDIYNEVDSFDANFNILSFFLQYSIEPGFQLLNIIGNRLHLTEPLFFYCLACIMNALFVSVLYRYPYPTLGILAFILSSTFFQEVNILRQVLAMSVILYSLKYIESYKPWHFCVGVLVAASFHTSAIICVLLLFLLLFRSDAKNKVLFWVVLSLWVLSLLSVLGISNIPILGSISDIMGGTRYDVKLSENDNLGYGTYQFNYFYNVLMVLVLLSLRKAYRVETIIIAMGCILQNFASQLAPLIRIALYFTALMPIAIGSVLSSMHFEMKMGKIIGYVRYLVIAYYVFVLIAHYILGSPILGSKFY